MAFIQSKKAFRFTAGEEEYEVPAEFVGTVPDWVPKTRLYELAVKGGDIVPADEPAKADAPDDKSGGKDAAGSTPDDKSKDKGKA